MLKGNKNVCTVLGRNFIRYEKNDSPYVPNMHVQSITFVYYEVKDKENVRPPKKKILLIDEYKKIQDKTVHDKNKLYTR